MKKLSLALGAAVLIALAWWLWRDEPERSDVSPVDGGPAPATANIVEPSSPMQPLAEPAASAAEAARETVTASLVPATSSQPRFTASGRVIDVRGRPVAGVTVYLYCDGPWAPDYEPPAKMRINGFELAAVECVTD